MGLYTTQRQLDGPFETSVPIQKLTEFYRANGYELVDVEGGSPEDSGAPEKGSRAKNRTAEFKRGEPSAGWWSSNMTHLPTTVRARHTSEGVEIEYKVDASGQHLTSDDRNFWERELRAAANYLRNPSRRPRDLRHEEAKRAEQLRRRMLSYGIWGAIFAFVLIVVVKLLTAA